MKDARQELQSPLGKGDNNCLYCPAYKYFEYFPAQVQRKRPAMAS